MAEEKPRGIKSTVSGWIKAVVTSVVGLLSGAVLMYLTPLVNNAIKPAKPVANFATQVNGLSVQINNRSTGGTHGWWDFGDGGALEPFDPKAETIKRVYTKPGKYEVKLTLQNLLNDESERSTTLVLDTAPPEITFFQLIPITSSDRAPAVYRMQSKVKNAGTCILSVGEDKPLEIIDDQANQERYLTFDEMGAYTVRLAAINGKQIVEKAVQVYVSGNEGLMPTAKLLVSYEAIKVERINRDMRITCDWPVGAKENTVPFRKERPAFGGGTIISAELLNKDEKNSAARNVKLEIAPDKSKLIVTGELTRPTTFLGPKTTPSWLAEVRVVMERRTAPQFIKCNDVAMAVNLNTTTKLPLQPLDEGYELVRKTVNVELWDGNRKVWESTKATTNAKVTLKNQACLVTAIPQHDGVVLKIDAPSITKAVAPPVVPAKHVPPPSPITLVPSPGPNVPVGPVARPVVQPNPLLPGRPMKN